MTERWDAAVADAADALGELLLEVAGDKADYTPDDIAPVVLRAGLAALLGDEPGPQRIEAVARAIHVKLHDPDAQAWASLTDTEKEFWCDIAGAAIAAADASLLREISPNDVH